MIETIDKIRKIDLFKVTFSGILIFGIIPHIRISPELIKSNLENVKKELEQIKLEYSNVEIKSILNNQNIKIELFTPKPIYSFEHNFMKNFIVELNVLLNRIDSDTFMKQISLDGIIKTVSYENNFEVNCENDGLKIINNYKYRKILGIIRI